MSKAKHQYRCTNCNNIEPKWTGCCASCNEWNSVIEEIIPDKTSSPAGAFSQGYTNNNPVKLQKLNEIEYEKNLRMTTGINEWDQVMGGGILPGSFMILTGDPGIGKSTLLLQVANEISSKKKVIYFSSEESMQQVKNRAERINIKSTSSLLFSDQATLQNIIQVGVSEKPDVLILDSIQNCHMGDNSKSIPGTIGQLREAGFHLCKLAKENNIAVLITGHITKEGSMAGPKILEHIVDGVFYLQGEDKWQTRILRSVKNRFGTINQTGFFEMGKDGLTQVPDINKIMLNEFSTAPGSSLVSSIEGSRPILLELQALCVTSKFGIPQRVITGIDYKRVVLIAAILEKYLHIKFSGQDIFFKVSGGFKIKNSCSDLGVALALLSSYFQKPLPPKSIAIAEISLTGQIKPASQINIQIHEAEKFGIKNILISSSQKIKTSCNTLAFKNIYELIKLFPE